MANDTSAPNFWDPQLMQGALSPQEKALRDLFVTEYLKDRDGLKAALRCGFIKSIASQYADDLLTCPYVQKQISLAEEKLNLDPEAARKSIKLGLLREAHNPFSPAAARVAALAQLAKIEGMGEKEKGDDAEMALINAFREFAAKAPV